LRAPRYCGHVTHTITTKGFSMLTPAQLHDMTPEARTALFEDLALRHYGTTANASLLGADFDVSRGTIFNWRKNDSTPFAVIFTLDRWVNGDGMGQRIEKNWDDLALALDATVRDFGHVLGAVSRIARLTAVSRPAAPEQQPEPEYQQLDEARSEADAQA
jgi:hypothetical protein